VSGRLPAGVRRLPSRVRLAAAIEALPDVDRLVLSLRLLEGLSAQETAGALRVSVSEVEKRTASAMLVLSQEIAVDPSLRRAA
jgi:DNA-directed RNA polymerase specialized sigma24 family protein